MDRGAVTQGLADRLRRLREERGWSAQRLADACASAGFPGLTRSTIAKIESGTRKSVTADEVTALAHVLGVPATDLLTQSSSSVRREVIDGTIVMVDLAAATHRADLRGGLDDTLRAGLAEVGIDFTGATVDYRGDGALIVLPSRVPKNKLAAQFPSAVAATLRRYNAEHDPAGRIQLRMVLHTGEVRLDESGVIGQAVTLAARLLDAGEAKSVLRLTPGVLALIVSDEFYEDVVRADPDGEPDVFRPIEVSLKNSRATAWLRLFDGARPTGPVRRGVPSVWGDVPPRNPNFVGRTELLDQLDDRLSGASAPVILPTALHGMGGIGKTQLAVEYVYRRLERYDLVWWIHAASLPRIHTDLTLLARQLDLPETSDTVSAVLRALRLGEPHSRWLLVFDNAEDPERVHPFIPANGPGQVLITSRNPQWAGYARPLEVPVFSRAESIELLRRRSFEIDDAAETLAERLGDLPLAVEQAATWQAETGMSTREYLRLFDEKLSEILTDLTPPRYEVSVGAAWNVSFDELGSRHPGAHQLLQLCAMLADEPIPRGMFAAARGVSISPELDPVLRDPIRLARAIREINRYALAKIDHRNDTLQIHRLVRLMLRERTSPNVRAGLRHGAHELLANYAAPPQSWQRYREVLPHAYASDVVDCQDSWVRQLAINLSRFLYVSGDHEEANALATRMRKRWTEVSGEYDKQSMEAAALVGTSLRALGRFTEAAEINRRTLELRTQSLGEDSEDVVESELLVASDLTARGDFNHAREVCEQTHRKAIRLFGDDDTITLQAAHALGVALRLRGEYHRALELDERTHQARVMVLGQEAPETLSTWNAVITDRRELGDYHRAHIEQETLTEQVRTIFGEDSPLTWRQTAELAVTKRKDGDHTGATRLSEAALTNTRNRYGDNHPNALACALGHSVSLRYDGDLAQARELGEATVDRYRLILGEDHPQTRAAQVNLANTLHAAGNAGAARHLHEQALQGLRATLGGDHPHTLACAANLANDLAELGEHETTTTLRQETRKQATRTLGESHPLTTAIHNQTACDIDPPPLW